MARPDIAFLADDDDIGIVGNAGSNGLRRNANRRTKEVPVRRQADRGFHAGSI